MDEDKITPKDVSIKVDQVFKTLFEDAISSYRQSQSVIDCVYSLIILRMFCANIVRSYHIHGLMILYPFDSVFHPHYTSYKSFNAFILLFSWKIILFKYIVALIAAHKCMFLSHKLLSDVNEL